uniref:Uncharacterized protein n=1 Tax=Anguilla anguilla TaxID=7936 RepID=A0A0E9TYE9_ANGAN
MQIYGSIFRFRCSKTETAGAKGGVGGVGGGGRSYVGHRVVTPRSHNAQPLHHRVLLQSLKT